MPALSLVEMTDEVRRRAADLFGARGVQLRLSTKPSETRRRLEQQPIHGRVPEASRSR